MNPRTRATKDSKTINVLKPRFIPDFVSFSTNGVIAIPINQARKTAEQLIKNGKATYPIVGVSIDMQFAGEGAKIADTSNAITPAGPASKAGLRSGDVIVTFDGRAIATPEELIVAIRSKNVGDRVAIEYIRSGKKYSTSLTLMAGK